MTRLQARFALSIAWSRSDRVPILGNKLPV
jgi:hypothetical protein